MYHHCEFTNQLLFLSDPKPIQYEYKIQKIFSLSGLYVGGEVLIDRVRTKSTPIKSSHDGLMFASLTKDLVERLNSVISTEAFGLGFKGGFIFVNIERSNLCDVNLIEMINRLNKNTLNAGFNLVIEITERNICGDCKEIIGGLERLKSKGILVAVDDYNLYDNDFRMCELDDGLYDIVKIRAPYNYSEFIILKEFIRVRREKVVIEMVETKEIFNEIKSMSQFVWGVQGFYFDRGTPLFL